MQMVSFAAIVQEEVKSKIKHSRQEDVDSRMVNGSSMMINLS